MDDDGLTKDSTPEYYKEIPVSALRHTAQHEISLHLNLPTLRGNDWRSIADMMDCRPIEIRNMEMKDSPMKAVLVRAMQKSVMLYDFVGYIRDMKRLDVIEECRQLIDSDARVYRDRQRQPTGESAGRQPLTLGELDTGSVEYFDAFVSSHPQDMKFVDKLIEELEVRSKLKLCIADRDMVIGVSNSHATAELIERRCKRVIIVLSNDYLCSEEDNMLHWELTLALAMAPSALRMNKIIPINIDGTTPPAILRPFCVSDYSNRAQGKWFWDKLIRSLRASTNGEGGYKGPQRIIASPEANGQDCNKLSSGSSQPSSQYSGTTPYSSPPPTYRQSRDSKSSPVSSLQAMTDSSSVAADTDSLASSSSGAESSLEPPNRQARNSRQRMI